MRAIVITRHGGPEVLEVRELPDPEPNPGEVLIRVKAFGLNRAETYMRRGEWPEIATVSGIECVGSVAGDPSGALADGTRVHVENVSTKPAADAPLDVTPEPSPAPTSAPTSNPVSAPALASAREPAAVAINAADADNAVISSAITAHVDSVVNDARRNVGKYAATR